MIRCARLSPGRAASVPVHELYCSSMTLRSLSHWQSLAIAWAFERRVTRRRSSATLSVLPVAMRAFASRRSMPLSDRAEQGSYGQFCPVAMAAEIVCSRWTALVLREMLCGTTRFNDLRRGVPRMSPTLLSKRLKELEDAGVIVGEADGPARRGRIQAHRSRRGSARHHHVARCLGSALGRIVAVAQESRSVAVDVGHAAQSRAVQPLPERRCTVKFDYPELSAGRKSVVARGRGNGQVDLCSVDPGYEVDLYVRSSLRSMTAVWMGVSTLKAEIDAGNIELTGDKAVRALDARVAGPEPIREGKKPRRELARRRGLGLHLRVWNFSAPVACPTEDFACPPPWRRCSSHAPTR